MGLFNKLLGNRHQKFSIPEAFAAIAVATIASDGYFLEEERERLLYLLSTLEVCQGYSASKLMSILDKLVEQFRQKGSQDFYQFNMK